VKIVTRKTEELVPHPANYRVHPPAQIAALADSLRFHAQPKPIVISVDNVILAGHGLVEAAKLAGLQTLECSIYEGESPEAFIIADNRTAEMAENDPSKLADLLQELDNGGFDMAATAFATDEIAALMHGLDEASGDKTLAALAAADPDMPESLPARATLGDTWQLGRHTLNVRDCRTVAIPAGCDTLVFDPPFQWDYVYEWIPDAQDGMALLVFSDAFRLAEAILAATDRGWTFQSEFVWDGLTSWYTPTRPLARHKVALVFSARKWDFDAALYTAENDARHESTVNNANGEYHYVPDPRGKHLTTVFPFANTRVENDHAHAKPAEWVRALLRGMGAQRIFDMCAGSGTITCVAENEGWNVTSCEIDPATADILLARWETHTGLQAVCIAQETITESVAKSVPDPNRYARSKFYRSKVWRDLRNEAVARDNHRCVLCGVKCAKDAIHVDHIQERNDGGADALENLQSLCTSCHSQKTGAKRKTGASPP